MGFIEKVKGAFGFGAKPREAIAKSPTTSVVIVGVESSKVFGSCPGARHDAQEMQKLMSQYTDDVTILLDDCATKRAVAAAFRRAVKNELCIFCYSGHGGNQALPDTGKEEADGKDEFLCLYDGPFLDNSVWKIISEGQGRVVMFLDCCHSSDMFRVQNPFAVGFGSVDTARTAGRTLHVVDDKVSALVWAGCHESTVSWGSSSGGKFTNTLLKYYNPELSYDDLWAKVSVDRNLLNCQIPYRVIIGNPFGGNKVFR